MQNELLIKTSYAKKILNSAEGLSKETHCFCEMPLQPDELNAEVMRPV